MEVQSTLIVLTGKQEEARSVGDTCPGGHRPSAKRRGSLRMHFGLASYSLALLAGLLSTLSPCVLPIVPILLGSAMNAHRRAPIALALGLAISYATIGTALAWAGTALELDSELVRRMGAALLGLFALVILSSSLQQRFAAATSGIGNAGNRLLSRLHLSGLYGQFVVGLVLGMIWSPMRWSDSRRGDCIGKPRETSCGLRSSHGAIQRWCCATDRDPWLYFTLSDDECSRKTPPGGKSREVCTRQCDAPDRDRHDFRQRQAGRGMACESFPGMADESYDALLR